MFNWAIRTPSEGKRDDYEKLYNKLTEAIADFDRHVSEADASYDHYRSSVPNLSNSKIPSNDFDTKREELNGRVLRYFNKDKEKRESLVRAKEKAYDKYLHYKQKAAEEAEEQLRKEREFLEGLFKW